MPTDNSKDAAFTTSYTKAAIRRMKKQDIALKNKCKELIDTMINLRRDIIKNI